jgi:hypothetical protein
MDSFYIIVGTIAILLLIGILAFLGVAMNKQYVSRPFPARTIQKCPDYWTADSNGKCIIPTGGAGLNNVGDLGTGSTLTSSKNGQYDNTMLYTPGLSADKKSIDFTKDNDAAWKTYNTMVGSNLNPLCQKQQWLNDHKVVWDGISNNNVC